MKRKLGIICFYLLISFLFYAHNLPKSIDDILEIIFIDYKIYFNALNNINCYGFFYFPSFFILTPLILNPIIYAIFLVLCICINQIILRELVKNRDAHFFFTIGNIGVLFVGNIDAFIFLVILICLKYRNEYITPILLAFICFKPTVFLIVPYFLLEAKNKTKFIAIFCGVFISVNCSFIFSIGITDFNPISIIRLFPNTLFKTWLMFVCYYYFKSYNDNLIFNVHNNNNNRKISP